MRLLLVVAVVSLVGCGAVGPVGPQGPAGPQGPSGSGGSTAGRLTFTVPTNSAARFLMASRPPMNAHTFKLGDQVAIPSTATAVYLEIGVCVPDATAAGARVFFTTPESENSAGMRATRPCSLNVNETRDVWFASSSRDLNVSVESEFGTPPGVLASVTVRGWFEP